ncbi:MAG: beta-lactamase family protein [Candidatus Obscuribacterales bacterium]|nr:beta-lactamase family protein [Candidatus Obscuribacterales bacterium]
MRIALLIFLFLILSNAPAHAREAGCRLPGLPELKALAGSSLAPKKGALQIAFTNGEEHRIYSFGTVTEKEKKAPNKKTLFEIGSVSKVFAATLLADLQSEKKFDLNSPVINYLPETIDLQSKGGKQITLFQLATHCSGLARDPDNLSKAKSKEYSRQQFHAFLQRSPLQFTPGSKFSYSNAAYSLLAEAIEYLGEKPYATMLKETVLQPLKMADTSFVLTEKQKENLAESFDKNGIALQNSASIGGATGGLKSSAEDLLRFLDAAILSKKNSRLNKDIKYCCKHSRRISNSESACLGWFRNETQHSYSKAGQIDGFSSCVAFSVEKKYAIAVLSSSLELDAGLLLSKCEELLSHKRSRPSL